MNNSLMNPADKNPWDCFLIKQSTTFCYEEKWNVSPVLSHVASCYRGKLDIT